MCSKVNQVTLLFVVYYLLMLNGSDCIKWNWMEEASGKLLISTKLNFRLVNVFQYFSFHLLNLQLHVFRPVYIFN